MGASCLTGSKQVAQPTNYSKITTINTDAPNFTADIIELHKQYVKMVLYVRDTKLFADRNDKLITAVRQYFANQFKVEDGNMEVICVDTVRKLHPKDYWFTAIDEEWMIQACLRQQKFSDETKV